MFRRRWLTFVLLLGAGLALTRGAGGSPPPGGEEKLWIALRDKATTREPLVLLGDIAAINGGTAAQRQRLAKLDLVELGPNRPTQVIPKELVFYRVRLAGLDVEEFQLLGANQTRIHFNKDAPATGLTTTPGEQDVPPKDEPFLVKSRDPVRLVARVGPLRIATMGEALQDGRMGQNIRVRNVDSNKVVNGRVVDSGHVEVDY